MSRPAFNIPAINNQLEALAVHLKLDSDNPEDTSKIECLDADVAGYREIHRFKFDGKIFHVSNASKKHEFDAIVSYNNNYWRIKAIS